LGQIASTIARSQHAFHSLRTLDQIMSMPREGDGQERHIDRVMTSGRVEFKDVSFQYPATETLALKNFTLAIKPGERVGIIGKIGSGKTTLGRLMARLYVPTQGTLLFDGVDIRQYHPSEIRRQVAFVAQDATLFYGSVRDNIVFGSPYVSDDLVVRAADLAGVTDFIKTNPAGFNLQVGEAGRALSSGQRQSVSLARAFLFDPLVVFLDEPSGSMDMASERALVERLGKAFRPDQTLIITTHRMAMLALVDRLVVIDNGSVVADGPRDDVIKNIAQISGSRTLAGPKAPGAKTAAKRRHTPKSGGEKATRERQRRSAVDKAS
jgi:ATP-binding cassette subfamily C protein LapB